MRGSSRERAPRHAPGPRINARALNVETWTGVVVVDCPRTDHAPNSLGSASTGRSGEEASASPSGQCGHIKRRADVRRLEPFRGRPTGGRGHEAPSRPQRSRLQPAGGGRDRLGGCAGPISAASTRPPTSGPQRDHPKSIVTLCQKSSLTKLLISIQFEKTS